MKSSLVTEIQGVPMFHPIPNPILHPLQFKVKHKPQMLRTDDVHEWKFAAFLQFPKITSRIQLKTLTFRQSKLYRFIDDENKMWIFISAILNDMQIR